MLQYMEDNDISIACLSETWFDAQEERFTARIKEAGYEVDHANRDKKRGGGVAMLHKKLVRMKYGEGSTTKYESFEFTYGIIRTTSYKMMLVCVYRLQELSCELFCKEMENFIEAIFHKADLMIVVGDFNIWLELRSNPDTKRFTSLMNAHGFTQTVDEPTHDEGHTLDNVYANESQIKLGVKVDRCETISDHCPIVVELPSVEQEPHEEYVSYRKFDETNVEKFRLEMKKVYEAEIDEGNNFEANYNLYRSASEKVLDDVFPVITKKGIQKRKVEWMDEEFRLNRARRRKLEKQWRNNKTENNRKEFVEQRKLCAHMSVQKQEAYYSKVVTDAGNDQKTLFKVVNKLLDKQRTRVLPDHTDAKQLADEFNDYYVQKIKKIRDTIPGDSEGMSLPTRLFEGERLERFKPVTEEDLQKMITKFGIKTSTEDPLPAKFLKIVIDEALPCLTKLVNQSLSEGSMDGVKLSVLDPLLKKAGLDIDIKKNYRPVNNLVFFSKLIERIVKEQLDQHMTTNRLHSGSQFGYKLFHSTETMMVGVTNEVLLGFDEGQCTVMLFLDLSAAFDTIDIEKLLEILYNEIGISGVALKWFRSFLTGRTQKVRIKEEFSKVLEVLFGAPQGSVLGPPLFNIYVRGQPLIFQACSFKSTSFADDSNGSKTFSLQFQFNILKNDVAKCMAEISHWMNIQFLKINPDKTEIILFHPKSLEDKVIIKGTFIGNQCIRFSREVKNVGVWLDEQLNLKTHVNKIVSHSFKLLKDIGRVRNVLSEKHTESLVHAVISSRLDQCNSLFINMSKDNIKKLQKVQNAAARLVTKKQKRDSISSTLKKLHWLKVESRIIFKVILLVYKSIHGLCSENLVVNYKQYNCRPTDFLLLETTVVETKYGRITFDYADPRPWNALPF